MGGPRRAEDEKLLCSVKLERASRPRSITPALGAIVETMAARGMLSKGATENCVADVFYPRKGFGNNAFEHQCCPGQSYQCQS